MDDGMANKGGPLDRYFCLLEAIAAAPSGSSLTELAARTGVPVTTVHRGLRNLLAAGLVAPARPGAKEYVLGGRVLRLAHAGSDLGWIRIQAQPLLDRVANRVNETCFIAKLVGTQVISIARAVPSHGISGYVVPGHAMPPHASASAKAILAYQPEAFVDRVLQGPLKRLSPRTRTDPATVKRELEEVRRSGLACCTEEIETGLVAYAVPVHLAGAGVLYSVGTSGLMDRFGRRQLEPVLAALREAAEDLSRSLHEGPPILADGQRSPAAG